MDAQAYWEEIDYQINARYDYAYECGAEARLLSAEPWDEPAGPAPEPEPQYPSCPVGLGYDIDDIPF